ncbi:MAG: nickel pincer cofactor biosynthesis protein LarB [Gemmatimonadota bacterium]
MTSDRVLEILQEVARGGATPQAALDRLSWLPVELMSDGAEQPEYARLDHHRGLRQGQPEVVFCPGKTIPQVVNICERLAERDGRFLATRVTTEMQQALAACFPAVEINVAGRVVQLGTAAPHPKFGTVLIACGGTSDIPVAEEAAACSSAFGNPIERLYDVGVAGLHRLLQEADALRDAAILIVVAGMEGALPSVIGGLVKMPVIAVPTSIGYGASFGGLAALLAMLNSCASGITVVNIDNGFGAACAATRINHLLARPI